MSKFYTRTTCRLCESNALDLAVPLQPIPIVSPNVGETISGINELLQVTAPLDVYRCLECGLMQLTTVLDPHLQYDTFMYETSISLGLREHFAKMAETLMSEEQRSVLSVFEIGSNDGTLLEFFKEKGATVLGVDPAKRIAEDASARGIPTLPEFFTAKLAKEIAAEYGKMDIVISNNTLANLDNLIDMVEGVRACLAPDGVFVFETQYALDVLDKLLLDVIYHEHLNYFSVKPLVTFFASKGFEVTKVERIWPKGGSIRVYVQLAGGKRPVDHSVADLIALEESKGLYTQAIYQNFYERIRFIATQIKAAINLAKKEQPKDVAVYGSSVGCASLINQFELGNSIQFIVDDNPFKRELVGPNYKLEVITREELLRRNPSLVIVLAWRYADSIRERNRDYLTSGGKFLIPFPEVGFISYPNELG